MSEVVKWQGSIETHEYIEHGIECKWHQESKRAQVSIIAQQFTQNKQDNGSGRIDWI